MNKTLFYLFMVFSMIFWGASWVNVKILSSYINEYEVIFFRLGISLITMIPILLYLKLDFRINFKALFLTVLASISLILYSLFFYLGVKNGSAGLGGALVTTLIPINTFVILAFLHKKVISIRHTFALTLGAFGVLTMLNIWQFNINEILSIENIYFILASLLWPILTIISSKSTNTHPLVFTFYLYLICTIFIYLFFIDIKIVNQSIEFDYIFWINMASLSVLATTFATSTYFLGIEKLGTKEVSSFIFLVPVSALLTSAIFLGEVINFNILLGTTCTIISIYILNNINIKEIIKR